MRIIINGIGGRMGKEVEKLVRENYRGAILAAGVDVREMELDVPFATRLSDIGAEADCIIDFSHHSSARELTDYAIERNIPLVIATTGQTPEELDIIEAAAKKIPVFFAANYSIGVALLIELAKITAATMPDADIEIIEKHHNRKLDAPSGTALAIANAIRKVREKAFFTFGRSGQQKRQTGEIGIHAVRMGNIVGEHEVIVGTDTQTITLSHSAHSRSLFAEGAVAAAEFIVGKEAGLYDMTDIVNVRV